MRSVWGPTLAFGGGRGEWVSKSETNDHWCTPAPVRDVVHEFFGGPPDLDPCSNIHSIMRGRIEWFGPPDGTDGLIVPWSGLLPKRNGRLTVFCNPPYSAKFEWAEKCWEEHHDCPRIEIVGLLPADTDTRWFQRYGADAARRCFWAGRLTFIGDRTYPARFPVVLPYWGPRPDEFERVFRNVGWCC